MKITVHIELEPHDMAEGAQGTSVTFEAHKAATVGRRTQQTSTEAAVAKAAFDALAKDVRSWLSKRGA